MLQQRFKGPPSPLSPLSLSPSRLNITGKLGGIGGACSRQAHSGTTGWWERVYVPIFHAMPFHLAKVRRSGLMYYRHLVSVGSVFYPSCGYLNVKLIRLCCQRDVSAFATPSIQPPPSSVPVSPPELDSAERF